MNTHKNYLLYAFGLFISLFGSNVYTFAIGLYVLDTTSNASAFANTLIFGMLPVILFSPLSGVMADRYNKKKIIVTTDCLNGCLFILMYHIASIGQLTLPVIYGLTFVVNTLTTLFDATMSASKVQIFDTDKIGAVNATSQVIRSSAIILAPILGGFVFGFVDISLFILTNGLSFIVSALIELFIDFPKHVPETHHTASLTSNFSEGALYIKNKKNIHPYILYFILLNFTIGLALNVPFPYIINTVLKRPAALLGSIEGIFPVGLLIGGLIVNKVMIRYSYGQILTSINKVMIGLLALVALPGLVEARFLTNTFLFVYYGCINFLFGVLISLIDVPIITILHQQVDKNIQGRVLSLIMSCVKVIYPIGLALSGLLIRRLNPFSLPFIGAIIVLVFSIYFSGMVKQEEVQVAPTPNSN